MGTKTTKSTWFLNQDKKKTSLVPNLDHETKKIRIRTQYVQNKNSIKFYCKENIKTWQGYDKKMYPKLVLNILKVMGYIYLYLLDT
jgi:hypothetical protein